MKLFNFFKKNNPKIEEINNEYDNGDDSKSKIGAYVALNKSVVTSTQQANIKYKKPIYNPQTRKQFYDDSTAHKRAIDNAFAGKTEIKDPYSGAILVKKQSDAKIQYGSDWQNHAAEADHIDPLSQIANRTKNNPFLTANDIKEIGNSDDNFQVISRKLNQGSKSIGKGGSTQKDWADDTTRMENLSDNIESGESIDIVRKRIRDTGKTAEIRNNKKAFNYSLKNAAGTFHQSGIQGAASSGTTAATMSGIINLVDVIKGKKTIDEALYDTAKNGGTAAAAGYVTGGGLTVLSQTLSYSSSSFLQGLANSNIPAKVITAITLTKDTIKQWANGEITTQECIIQLGDKGLNIATMGYFAAAGQALIPIPIVGMAIGSLVGSMLTSNLYNSLMNDLRIKQFEHEERMRIIAECNELAEQTKRFREELESYLDSYFKEYRSCFDTAISSMQLAYVSGDADGMIAGANTVTRKLGGQIKYETVNEFKVFLDSNEYDIL